MYAISIASESHAFEQNGIWECLRVRARVHCYGYTNKTSNHFDRIALFVLIHRRHIQTQPKIKTHKKRKDKERGKQYRWSLVKLNYIVL